MLMKVRKKNPGSFPLSGSIPKVNWVHSGPKPISHFVEVLWKYFSSFGVVLLANQTSKHTNKQTQIKT